MNTRSLRVYRDDTLSITFTLPASAAYFSKITAGQTRFPKGKPLGIAEEGYF